MTEPTTRKPYLTRRVFDGLRLLAERAAAQTQEEVEAIAWIDAMHGWRVLQSQAHAHGARGAALSPEQPDGVGNHPIGDSGDSSSIG